MVSYSKDDPKVLLSLRADEILAALASDQELAEKGGCTADEQDHALKQAQYDDCQFTLLNYHVQMLTKIQIQAHTCLPP